VSTLVVRLRGPLQSYGEATKFSVRGTLRYPSYSALLGMCRAARGIGRDASTADSDFLLDLRMAIRLDGIGAILTDFHTVNPRDLNGYANLDKIDSEKKQRLKTVVTTGEGKPWITRETTLATLVTRRAYLQDSEFLWLIEGDDAVIDELRSALAKPTWQLSLGRKACIPDWPLVLGITAKSIEDAASWVPVVRREQRLVQRNLEETPKEETPKEETPKEETPKEETPKEETPKEKRTLHMLGEAGSVVNLDRPLGNGIYNGYTTLTRKSLSIEVSGSVTSRRELLEWVGENFQ